jgi:uncharacterized small protein (DUF1192 family)
LAAENGTKPDNLAQTVTEVSERVSVLIREEVELAKAEMTYKAMSLLRGIVAVAAGALFGVFAIVFMLLTIAWALDAILINGAGDIWEGFAIVFGILGILSLGAFMFAWRKIKVGTPPTPKMAIEEAKRIRETVSTKTEGPS